MATKKAKTGAAQPKADAEMVEKVFQYATMNAEVLAVHIKNVGKRLTPEDKNRAIDKAIEALEAGKVDPQDGSQES
jgi:hypothetical protein